VFHKNALLRAAHEIQMPAMSPTMTEGAIKKWNKKEGFFFSFISLKQKDKKYVNSQFKIYNIF